jgi:hypothetical protein
VRCETQARNRQGSRGGLGRAVTAGCPRCHRGRSREWHITLRSCGRSRRGRRSDGRMLVYDPRVPTGAKRAPEDVVTPRTVVSREMFTRRNEPDLYGQAGLRDSLCDAIREQEPRSFSSGTRKSGASTRAATERG